MQPIVKFDRTLVTVLVDEVVHVLLELVAPPAESVERAPLDVVVVLDRSGSMSGAPLASVTAATAQLLRLAGPDDRIGVVAFDSEVQLVLPLAHHDADSAATSVLAIRSGGSTNLSGGWLKGLEMLTTDARADALRRIIVLTDGHANAGIIGADQLVPLIKGGYRQGVTTSCIGFDDGYDEKLLAALADGGMGNDYWCAGPDQAAQVFVAEFGGLASVVAQNVSVEIRPTDAVAATEVLNEFPMTDVPGGVQVALGDAYGNERRKVVAKFHLRPAPGAGPIDVASLVIRWASTTGDIALHTVTVPVVVTAGSSDRTDTGASPEVTEEVLRLEVARSRREANVEVQRGNVRGASRRMFAAARLATRLPDQATAKELQTDAQALQGGTWSEADAKRNFSRSRTASKGRRTDYADDSTDDQTGGDGQGSPPA